MTSLWTLANQTHAFPVLDHDTEADVVVLGAGVTGLTTAIRLAEAGYSVVVLESARVGEGSTGGSTGNLYSTLSSGLAGLRDKWDDNTVRAVTSARAQAMDTVETLAQRFNIDCAFRRSPLYRLVTSPGNEQALRDLNREKEAHLAAGYALGPMDAALGNLTLQNGFKLNDQAQFNPLAYAQGLALAAQAMGVRIFEYSRADRVRWRSQTVHGELGSVRGDHIVHATHTPKGISLTQTVMMPYLEYGVAARASPVSGGDGIFWITNDHISLRRYQHGDDAYLVAVGEKHKTGEHGDATSHHEPLHRYLTTHFDGVSAPTHGWSAQQFKAPDGLPLIGPSPLADRHYIATGFAADGLVWGTLAADVLCAHITGEQSPWKDLFSPRRFTPLKSAGAWAAENAHVGKHMLLDYLPTGDNDLEGLAPGSGRVIRHDGQKLAVYRHANGSLTAVSAICPHLKCVVHWNHSADTWDCPCHGSRFDIQGRVIDGPACQPLAPSSL